MSCFFTLHIVILEISGNYLKMQILFSQQTPFLFSLFMSTQKDT